MPRKIISSRHLRRLVIAAVVFVATAVFFGDRAAFELIFEQPQTANKPFQTEDKSRYHDRSFLVTKVVDGDTLDIAAPDGKYENTRIRLWGVDTPETAASPKGKMYFGAEASQFAKSVAMGKNVTVYLTEIRTRDKYGRLLAYVKLDDGRFLNEALLSEGFAYADVRFEHALFYKYQQLEAAARASKRGLWANVTREQLPQWLQKEKPNLLKK